MDFRVVLMNFVVRAANHVTTNVLFKGIQMFLGPTEFEFHSLNHVCCGPNGRGSRVHAYVAQ